jgi:hypothetical protein
VKELPPDEETEELEAYITPEGERRFRRKVYTMSIVELAPIEALAKEYYAEY